MQNRQLFSGFSEEQQAEYEKEAMQLYDPEIIKESNQRWKDLSTMVKQQLLDEGKSITEEFLKAMREGPSSSAAQQAVVHWRSHMNNFWTPDNDQLIGLANLYIEDPRFKCNYDQYDPNLAEFIRDAVVVYVQKQKKQP